MYRAVTLKVLEENIDLTDHEKISAAALNSEITFLSDTEKTVIFLDGVDVSEKIRSPFITKNIKYIADNKKVREILVKKQQSFASKGGIVMDGRDIGTIVFPNAELKIFMIASPKIRALRRFSELNKKNNLQYQEIYNDILQRDKEDEERKHSPLKKAPDAITINTDNLTLLEQNQLILTMAKKIIEKIN